MVISASNVNHLKRSPVPIALTARLDTLPKKLYPSKAPLPLNSAQNAQLITKSQVREILVYRAYKEATAVNARFHYLLMVSYSVIIIKFQKMLF
ncbi:unnamed protein product [Gongylonema pulchrum]|uniref:Complex I-B15 n=1 Tax=Gongylonema pulchrum TaxID=637853 RepID=A0A183E3S9_9BILA|nr:unnamed protein product [Gongylonema pulchrum]